MRPKFIAVAAVTIDGKITRSKNGGSAWTSKEDRDFLHKELDKCDLIIVGNTTYKLARQPLSKRKCLVFTRKVKGYKKVNENLSYINPLSISPYSITNRGRSPLSPFSTFREERGRQRGGKEIRICILGGAQIYSWFLQRNLIDDIFLTIEPVVFGQGINMFNINAERKFKLISVKKLNRKSTIVLHYKKINNKPSLRSRF